MIVVKAVIKKAEEESLMTLNSVDVYGFMCVWSALVRPHWSTVSTSVAPNTGRDLFAVVLDEGHRDGQRD